MEGEEEKKLRKRGVNKILERNGLSPIDLSKTERRIGNTKRSDFEQANRIRAGLEKKDKMDRTMNADGLAEALLLTNDLTAKRTEKDPILDYIEARTPKQDYTEKYEDTTMENNENTDKTKEFDENKADIIDDELDENNLEMENSESTKEELQNDFDENRLDITSTGEEIGDVRDEFDENELDMLGEKQIEKEFSENARDITGETDDKTENPDLAYRP